MMPLSRRVLLAVALFSLAIPPTLAFAASWQGMCTKCGNIKKVSGPPDSNSLSKKCIAALENGKSCQGVVIWTQTR